jgi:hypothetical protein
MLFYTFAHDMSSPCSLRSSRRFPPNRFSHNQWRLSGRCPCSGWHSADASGWPRILQASGTRPRVASLEKRERANDHVVPIPLRCPIPEKAVNLLVAGRLVDADRDAFAAIRVLVNPDQAGEAAGVAAALCLEKAPVAGAGRPAPPRAGPRPRGRRLAMAAQWGDNRGADRGARSRSERKRV